TGTWSPATISTAANGTYTFTPNAGQCAIATTMNISVDIVATPTATIVDPTCAVATGTITVTAPLGAQYTYSIDGTNFQASTTFNNVVSKSYTLTVKNGSGCSAAATIGVKAAPAAPKLVITSPSAVCSP